VLRGTGARLSIKGPSKGTGDDEVSLAVRRQRETVAGARPTRSLEPAKLAGGTEASQNETIRTAGCERLAAERALVIIQRAGKISIAGAVDGNGQARIGAFAAKSTGPGSGCRAGAIRILPHQKDRSLPRAARAAEQKPDDEEEAQLREARHGPA
jgi:hypothetical protein